MPRIDEDVAKAVVHVYPSFKSADADLEEGGTGFIMAIPMEGIGQHMVDHLYVVTNRHVIGEEREPAVVLRGSDGKRAPVRIPTNSWYRHPNGPDDVCVAALPDIALNEYDIGAFPASHCIRRDQIEALRVELGIDVYYVGRFKSDKDEPSITTVRFGSISAMPVMVKHPRFKDHVESYLVETRSRGGFSGSPVVAMLMGPAVEKEHARSHIHVAANSFLLGISWGHMNEWQEARLMGSKADLLIGLNAGMFCVTPAWRILDILARQELVTRRQHDRDVWLRDRAELS
jgi:hypothetical protein